MAKHNRPEVETQGIELMDSWNSHMGLKRISAWAGSGHRVSDVFVKYPDGKNREASNGYQFMMSRNGRQIVVTLADITDEEES